MLVDGGAVWEIDRGDGLMKLYIRKQLRTQIRNKKLKIIYIYIYILENN
jgi:hypothetical protein